MSNEDNNYPKMLYRLGSMIEVDGQKLDHLIVKNAEEEKAAKGCVDHPTKVKKPKIAIWLKTKFKPWWVEWEWLVKAITVILSAIAAIVILSAKFFI